MEIMQGRVSNFETSEELSDLKQKYRTEFLLQASKIFYNNLAYKINNNSVTLEDLNYVITTWEAIISYHSSYGTSDAINQELIQDFLLVYQYLNDYCMYKQDENSNIKVYANLTFLTTSQKERIRNKINGSRIELT